jgi:nickel-dependent lactate racemase
LVNENGVIILLAACPGGWGAESVFKEWVTMLSPQEVVSRARERAHFSLGAHGANLLAEPLVVKGAKVILVTCTPLVAELKDSYVDAVSSLGEAMEIADRVTGRNSSVLLVRHARRLIIEP